MPDFVLHDALTRSDLGNGVTLHTRHLAGTVRVGAPDGARDLDGFLEAALADAGLERRHVIELTATPSTAPADEGARAVAAVATPEPPAARLDVTVGENEGCVLLVEDTATGALRWVIPDNAEEPADAAETRELATSLRFTIPVGGNVAPDRSRALGSVASVGKTIKTFFYKITDELLGPIIHGFAKKWEAQHRPCFTRTFGPGDYPNDDPQFPRFTDADWRRMSQGRALLFVHGTFSTSGAFASIQPDVMAELSRRYGGRVFAFNHPTMTADPRENAIAFLRDIPTGTKLDVDLVCHSRGGLVARQIALLGETMGSVAVRRIVFVGATNAGTALADDDHMVDMIDRFTTIVKFVPDPTARKLVDALVLVVKILGHGLLSDLEGLRAMNPRGAFMKALNVPGTTKAEYYAIASDFEPKPGTPFLSLTRAEDLAADSIFENSANDLVVPRDGVFATNGAGGFPIGDARCLKFGPADGVIHTEFFGESRTNAQLLEWLTAEAAGARALALGPSLDQVSRSLDAFRDHALAMFSAQRGARGLAQADTPFTPGELDALRPHVVNLSEGAFKQDGIFPTSPTDVDAIVGEHIPRWAAALPAGEPLRVIVYAHGGLVGETDGLRIAQKHVQWWKRNGVYPVYFVWETGLYDALRAILEAVARRVPGLGARDLFDFTTDPVVQEGVRALGGVHIWGAMKHFAELSSAHGGGAQYVAQQLNRLATTPALANNRPVEFHAVGHSAGSIFHSWFLPMAHTAGLPVFKTLQFLAPAITIPEFAERLESHIGGAGAYADRAMMYTMKRSYEEDDDCIAIYRKSLLYLIYHALEPERRTPILGLEISVRADPAAAALFGLNGAPAAAGEVVWSITDDGGRGSSRSISHGGFDDDPMTMSSVAANVLDEPHARVLYTGDSGAGAGARGFDRWPISNDWLAGIDLTSVGPLSPSERIAAAGPKPAPPEAASPASTSVAPALTAGPSSGAQRPGARGNYRALCVGIDAYPGPNRLAGCVGDTRAWSNALSALGFKTVNVLTDAQATHAAVVDALRQMVTSAKAGDVLVFQYSGHGTQVRDTNGDEDDGKDEALVPIDFDSGAFLIDDDLRAIFDQLPAAVNLTCFIDCCHSGTITRMLGRNADADEVMHARYLKRTDQWDDWMAAHERFRERDRSARAFTPSAARALVDQNALRWVNFSACDAHESALEHDGNGDFTRIACRLLSGDIARYTQRSFQDAVINAFGERRRQTPQLDCPDASRDSRLLQPFG